MREICKMLFAISCIWLDRCGISTLQLAILFIWIAVSAIDADPICFIYRIRSSPCRKMTGASCLYVGISQKSELIIQANTPPCRIL